MGWTAILPHLGFPILLDHPVMKAVDWSLIMTNMVSRWVSCQSQHGRGVHRQCVVLPGVARGQTRAGPCPNALHHGSTEYCFQAPCFDDFSSVLGFF
jgi:hypothetical protein